MSSSTSTILNFSSAAVPGVISQMPDDPRWLTPAVCASHLESDGSGIPEPEKAVHPAAHISYFFVRRGPHLIKLATSDIRHIKVEGKYCSLTSSDGTFLAQIALKDMLAQLPAANFVRIHRNHVVSIDSIRRVCPADGHIELVDGTIVPLSRKYGQRLKMHLHVL